MSKIKQTKRAKTKNQQAPASGLVAKLTSRLLLPNQALVAMAEDVLVSLNSIIDGSGNFTDWMKVLHRITFGSYAYDTYFKRLPEMTNAFHEAWIAITLVKLRTHQTGTFGIKVQELDSLTYILSTIDQMTREMNTAEIYQVYTTTDDYYVTLVKANQRLDPEHQKTLITKALQQEFQEVKTLDPLKVAA